MKLSSIPPGAIDWPTIPGSPHAGETGTVTAQSCQLGEIQLRLVRYSENYLADHWCHKGHIVYVVSGTVTIEHRNGHRYDLSAGMSYHVADNEAEPHRVLSKDGASLFIVD